MLYTFISNDFVQAQGAAMGVISKLLAKNPDSYFVSYGVEDWDNVQFEELLNSNALFKENYIVLFKKVLSNEKSKEELFKYLRELKDSKHLFFIVDAEISDKDTRHLKENSDKFIFKTSVSSALKSEFNLFAITDALYSGDKKKIWSVYIQSLKKASAENIYGILWWAIKNIIIASKTTQGNSGLKPFVYNKAKSSKFSPKNRMFERCVEDFVSLPYKSMKYDMDLGLYIELWILTLNTKK